MQTTKLRRNSSRLLSQPLRRALLFSLLLLLVCASQISAQDPNPAATGATDKSNEGFTPGWGAGARFEGTSSGDGSVFDLGFGAGYAFSRHFLVDLGAPFYFVGTPSSIKQKNQQSVSGVGIGAFGGDLKFIFTERAFSYAPTIHLTAPTGDKKKGFSTGHATWNWSNHLEHGFGTLTPFVDAGVGNSVTDTHFFHRPFITFGYAAQFEAGTEVDVFGPVSLTVSAYDVAPWGPQTVISRVFRCGPNGACTKTTNSKNRRGYTQTSVETGAADLVRDNGFNAGVELKPIHYLDLEFDYSRSVPLRLSSFSFGIALDLRSVFQQKPHTLGKALTAF
jgi:hypothetical protein